MQREIEAWGIPTISLSNNPSQSRRIRPPRWVHVRFPRGSMLGEPGNREKQMGVLRAAFEALEAISEPGGHIELPYRWEAAPVIFDGKPLVDGSYS